MKSVFCNNIRAIALIPVLLVAVLATGISTASAQTSVALCDIGRIFKNHPGFSANLEALKQQARDFEAQNNGIQQQMMQKAEMLQTFKPNSEDYRNFESKLAQESAALEVQQRDEMRKLMQREAQLHYDTYVEVINEVASYCEQENIQLILRYNNDEMSMEDPGTIMQKINGNVIYHRNQKDITETVIRILAQKNAAAGAPDRR